MSLPGVSTYLRDRFYSLSRTNITEGPRVALLARRKALADLDIGAEGVFASNEEAEAADFRAIQIRSELSAIKRFGNGSELHRGYLELLSGGAARIYCVPIPDSVTDEELVDDDEEGVTLRAFGAAEIVRPDIIVPWGRGWHPSDAALEYDDVAEEWDPYTVPVGFAADYQVDTVKLVADLCREITDRTYPVFAVLGVTPARGQDELTAKEINDHLLLPSLPDRDVIPQAHYVSVVVAELAPVSRQNTYKTDFGYSNGAGIYAGMVSAIVSEVSPTFQRIPNIAPAGQRYVPNRSQQVAMIDDGVVPIAQNFQQVPIVVDGQTFGRATSDYTRLSTLRIVFDTIQLVRAAAEDFVGMTATIEHKNALDTAISSQLRNMKIQGALIDADHMVTYEPRANKAHIELVLTPAFELRNIEITISVQL